MSRRGPSPVWHPFTQHALQPDAIEIARSGGAWLETPDGRRMVSVSDDRFIKVWDLERWVHLATFSADTSLVSCAIVPDGMTVIAGDGWGAVHILRLEGTT